MSYIATAHLDYLLICTLEILLPTYLLTSNAYYLSRCHDQLRVLPVYYR